MSDVAYEVRPTGETNGSGKPCAFAVVKLEGSVDERIRSGWTPERVRTFRSHIDPEGARLRAAAFARALQARHDDLGARDASKGRAT